MLHVMNLRLFYIHTQSNHQKYAIQLIPSAKLNELYILTNSGTKACKSPSDTGNFGGTDLKAAEFWIFN